MGDRVTILTRVPPEVRLLVDAYQEAHGFPSLSAALEHMVIAAALFDRHTARRAAQYMLTDLRTFTAARLRDDELPTDLRPEGAPNT